MSTQIINSLNEDTNAPRTGLCDNVRTLHEMISKAEVVAIEIKTVLFGEKIAQEKCPEHSATCVDEDLNIMLCQMRRLLDCLCETRTLLG